MRRAAVWILAGLALVIAIGLAAGVSMWPWICAYWIVNAAKNAAEAALNE